MTLQARGTDHCQLVKTHTHTHLCMHTVSGTQRERVHPREKKCLPEDFLSWGALPSPARPHTATEVLTQGKHLKTEWLPGRRTGKGGMGWGGAWRQEELKRFSSWVTTKAGSSQRTVGLQPRGRGRACFYRWGQRFLHLHDHTSGPG